MWAAVLNILMGAWLMISPAVFDMKNGPADNNHIIGPLVITFSVISLWDINKKAGKVNILLGAWLLAAFFIFNYTNRGVIVSNSIAAVLIILLSLVKRKALHQYGGGWRSLLQHHPPHLREAEKLSAGTKT